MSSKGKDGGKPGIDAAAVRELAELLKETGLTEIEIEHDGARIRVSRTQELSGARSFVPSAEWVKGEQARAMAEALGSITNPVPAEDHPALQVAFGGYDLAVFFAAGPWDLAAPSIVVEEAGGKFTDIAGLPTLTGGGVFSNGRIHAAAIECLRAAREP